ncbi:MAG TPA: AAA family ATPase, partial [bacterium]|nr:AAA family ATPase [bacterium]
MWIERACSDTVLKAVKTRPAVLLTGMRQSGKSSLLKRLFPEAVYVTLDDMILAREANEKPKMFLKRFENASRVIIDEIQYAPDLLREL